MLDHNHMKQFLKKYKNNIVFGKGFVLPFTLLICAIMLLISVGISSVLIKQITFSNIQRDSQAAYYAADNALACAISVDETYTYNGKGLFPSDSTSVDPTGDMTIQLLDIKNLRAAIEPPLMPLADKLIDIRCAQSAIFEVSSVTSDFTTGKPFSRTYPDPMGGPDITELGVATTFKMKMKIDDGTYRCAKVTVNKTATYKQIIAQGYSQCDRPRGSIERAVVYSTVQ